MCPWRFAKVPQPKYHGSPVPSLLLFSRNIDGTEPLMPASKLRHLVANQHPKLPLISP